MRLTILILVTCLLQVSASTKAQRISLSEKNASLETIIRKIRNQSNYYFVGNTKLIRQAKLIDISVKNVTIEDALNQCFANQPLMYSIIDKTVVIKTKTVLSPTQIAEQKVPVKGKVMDQNGMGLPGASVKIEGSSVTASTNAKGEFEIEAPNKEAFILVSYVGYEVSRLKVEEGAFMNIRLKPQLRDLSEIVVVGYGTKLKSEISSSISSVNVSQLSANASNNVSDALQGRVAGVSVESNNGTPGAKASITIRGSSTLGANGPLVVIDGMPFGSLDGLNPADIQNIEVLKDAAAASIYGSRAAGGVILVTTKLGRKNTEPTIQVNGVYSSQSIPKRMPVLNGEQWTKLFNSLGGTTFPAYNGTSTDWQEAIFRTAPIYKVNGDVTGGSEHFQYSLSGSYLNQQGTVEKTDFKATNFRAKSVYEKGRIKIGETFIYNRENGRSLPAGNDQTHSVILSSLVLPPTVPIYDPKRPLGGWGGIVTGMKNLSNPVADLHSFDNQFNSSSITADIFAEIRLVDQLKYKVNAGLSESRGFNNNYVFAFDDGNGKQALPSLSMGSGLSNSWLLEHTLSYDKKIGLHNISLLAGYTAQRDTTTSFNGSGKQLPNGTYNLGSATTDKNVGGSLGDVRRESLIGRVSYSYDSRYLISASIRRDGSSIFASGYRYGVFPSVSAGWTLSNEKFYSASGISAFMNYLKFRGSYGLLGNDQISNYSTINGIRSNLNFLTDAGMVLGSIPSGNASPADLEWEETKTIDAGLDAAFFNNKLSLVFDWYKKESTGVLLAVPIPLSTGTGGAPIVNAGTVSNKGIELSLDYADQAGDFNYRIGWNMSANRNKMTAITIGSGKQQFGDIQRAVVGSPLGSFFLIKTDGLFKTQAEIDNYKGPNGQKIQGNAAPGDIKFVDFNNDGIIDNNDQQYVGSPIPTFETGVSGSLSWKGLDLNLLVQGTFGNKIFNGGRYWLESMNAYANLFTTVLDAWTPQNSGSSFPRFTLNDPNLNARENSDRWLESGAFVRVKRIEVGYTLDANTLKNLNVGKVRGYVSAQNLFTFTDYKGYNPDLGNGGGPLSRGRDGGYYPLQRIISLGVNVTF
ncbi:TonB-dependent receptor [Pedobacter nyackensis]|uniref:TonB-dependent receptor n=1 Tax=Pedobacter nyackensis TaxID=475255 RepID=UPI00292CB1E9|nr:TonB-dependent receptor [Pedobacter nyackensis]